MYHAKFLFRKKYIYIYSEPFTNEAFPEIFYFVYNLLVLKNSSSDKQDRRIAINFKERQ